MTDYSTSLSALSSAAAAASAAAVAAAAAAAVSPGAVESTGNDGSTMSQRASSAVNAPCPSESTTTTTTSTLISSSTHVAAPMPFGQQANANCGDSHRLLAGSIMTPSVSVTSPATVSMGMSEHFPFSVTSSSTAAYGTAAVASHFSAFPGAPTAASMCSVEASTSAPSSPYLSGIGGGDLGSTATTALQNSTSLASFGFTQEQVACVCEVLEQSANIDRLAR